MPTRRPNRKPSVDDGRRRASLPIGLIAFAARCGDAGARRATDASGHSFAAMMEAAGAAVARAILEQNAPHLPRPLILVGPGNNGGDGLVCARHLLEAGAQPRVFVWKRTTGAGGIVDEQLARLSDGRVEDRAR